uniref:PPP4R2, putative n=1 Tax=Theileria annulata TaxID=5874 RepID=A0A3B0N3X6_THEAN
MNSSKVCKALDEIGIDEEYWKLKSDLLKEFTSKEDCVPGAAYKQILNGVLDVLSQYEDIDKEVKLNKECFIVIEDIATTGRCRYPWKVVKMLIVVVYNKLFDELYQSNRASKGVQNSATTGTDSSEPSDSSTDSEKPKESQPANNKINQLESEEEFRQLKIDCLVHIVEFDIPPFTLQRICEIPLKQPYTVFRKLFNAYRKLFNVRNIEYEPIKMPEFFNPSDHPQLDRVYSILDSWEAKYKNLTPEWSDELLFDNSEDFESSDEKPFKRPLE